MYNEEAGVEVYVRPYHNNTAYREYEAPRSSPLYTGYENERYIEAVNNEQFEVFVKLDKSFDFKTYNQARVMLAIDGSSVAVKGIQAKPKGTAETSLSIKGALTCHAGKWACAGFYFRELKTLEENHLTIEEEDDEVSKRGKIEVILQLGRKKRVNGTYNWGHNCALPEGTSKKVTVDHGKSHGVAMVPLDVDVRAKRISRWISASGNAGTKINFTFFYASRMILELKDIIPSTAFAPNKRTEGDQKNGDQEKESHNEEQHLQLIEPRVATTSPKLSAKAKNTETQISLDSDDEEDPPPSKKIKAEVIEGTPSTGAASKSPATSTTKSSKARERARIESQLEEIRLQREENRLRREMMDLEEGELD